jgi:phosphocarrier protein HPr
VNRPRDANNVPAGETRRVVIGNRLGLHARAAAKFVEAASAFECEIEVEKGGTKVSGKSILGLIMLAAGPGSEIALQARGADAGAALDALVRLIEDRFHED